MGSMDPTPQLALTLLSVGALCLGAAGLCVLVQRYRTRHARRAAHDRLRLSSEDQQAWRALTSRKHRKRTGPEPEKAWWW